jgi:predicted nucleotide-binding protein
VSPGQAAQEIQGSLEEGRALLEARINVRSDLVTVQARYNRWDDGNLRLLSCLFGDPSVAEGYRGLAAGQQEGGRTSLGSSIRSLRASIEEKISTLASLKDRLSLIPFVPAVTPGGDVPYVKKSAKKGKIFVVHGHDELAKESVARFLERLGLTAVILHEQPNAGLTIIEKLERFAHVDFAVVLLTPDDVGAPAGRTGSPQPRARQNVIFELGLFIGRLGRRHVCTLYKGDVELPSDSHGIVYTPMDPSGGWRGALAKELIEAGFAIDATKAL